MKSKHFTVNSKTCIVVQFIPKIKFINNPKLTRWCSFLDCDPILVTRDSDSDVTSEDVTIVTNNQPSQTWRKRYFDIFCIKLVLFVWYYLGYYMLNEQPLERLK